MRSGVALGALATVCLLAAPSKEERVAKIESGLTPRVRIEGQSVTRWPIAERMKFHNVPAVGVAVVEDGKLSWAKTYGAGWSVRTRFQAASISKPVAAVAALRLVARGDLSLDEDVNKKLKSWKVPENQWGKPITLRQLLSHTAGLTVHGFPGYAKTAEIPTGVQIVKGGPPANTAAVVVNVEPGTIFRYSGGGYQVLQVLIEDVTGKPFARAVKELVLDPADMKDSGYDQPPIASAARGHNSKGEPIAGDWHIHPEQAAAGLWTTPTDVARFLIAVHTSKLLPPAVTKEMLTPVKDGYALGFGIEGEGQAESFGHNGSNVGYRCFAVLYKNGKHGLVVMTNGDSGAGVAGEIVRAVAEEYGWSSHRAVMLKAADVSDGQVGRR
ncbi:MAG TPA: serine hydrolase domain-containing protein [Bryobacteraceae bacterium]|nr:serine hydrolase domain-containing protein [Bryobacteraceae bacterium]